MTRHDAAAAVRRVRCVGAVVLDDSGRLLLIQRGHEPAMGCWSVPGGRVEPGETDEQAVQREIAEETGLLVEVGPLVGSVERSGGPGVIYEIYDYDAVLVPGPASDPAVPAAAMEKSTDRTPPHRAGGEASAADWARVAADAAAADRARVTTEASGPGRAGDDAADLTWATRADLGRLPLTDGLIDALTDWGRLPR